MRPVYECPKCKYRWMPRRRAQDGKYPPPRLCPACHKYVALDIQRDSLLLKSVRRKNRIKDRQPRPLHPVIREALKRLYLSTD